MRKELPWDYSIPKGPNDKGMPNLPCEAGAALGREIARFAATEEAKQRKQFPKMLPMCDECLCRPGTAPNRTAATLMDLIKCIHENKAFYCHKGVPEDGEPKRLCTGYFVLAASSSVTEKQPTLPEIIRAAERGLAAAGPRGDGTEVGRG